MHATHLILIVPDLEALVREAGETTRICARIMARGRQAALDSDFPQFSLLFPDRPAPGAAAIARRADLPDESHGAGTGHWLRCDPVALVPDLTRVWVGETRFETIPARAGEAVKHALAGFFSSEGLQFHMPAPGRGYIHLDQAPDCRFRPPWRIAGESLDHVLPEGSDAARWCRLLNESQMLLHNLDELKVLPQSARPTSVWFWGAEPAKVGTRDSGLEKAGTRDSGLGTRGMRHGADTQHPLFPDSGGVATASVGHGAGSSESRVPSPESRNLRLIGEDPLIRGLSDWLAVPHLPTSTRPDGGRWLVQWDADRNRSASDNLSELEERWLAPAWSGLRWGRVRRMTLASMISRWDLGVMGAWIGKR